MKISQLKRWREMCVEKFRKCFAYNKFKNYLTEQSSKKVLLLKIIHNVAIVQQVTLDQSNLCKF